MRNIKFLLLVLSRVFARYRRRLSLRRMTLRLPTFSILERDSNERVHPFLHFFFSRGQVFFFLVMAGMIGVVLISRSSLGFSHRNFVSQGIVGVYTQGNLPIVVTNLLSQPLVSLDKNGKPQPKLAASWQVNNDGTHYIFKLRKNLTWSDGTKLKAADLKFNLSDVEVSYLDDETIEFRLADSFYPFPTLLTTPVLKNGTFIGMGAYKVASSDISRNLVTRLILIPARNTPEEGQLPMISVRFYPDEKTARTAFELGEVQSLVGITETHELLNQPSVKLLKIPVYNKLVAVFYNTQDSALKDKNLRKALSLAVPGIEGEEQAKSPIPPFSWAYNNSVKDYLNNPQEAKNYLTKVPQKDLTITLTVTPWLRDLGERIAASWKSLGVDTILRVESGMPQNFQALLTVQPIPADPDQYSLWHSTQTKTNLSKYDFNKRIDRDLEDGRRVGDIEKRKERYLDFQKNITEDLPATFLYFPKSTVIYRQKVANDLSKILPLQFYN